MSQPGNAGRRVHLGVTVVLAGCLAALLGLVAAGRLEVRRVDRAPEPGPATDPGPRVERVTDADKYFRLLGRRGVCYRFDGAWVDCWVEVTVGGRRTDVGADLGSQFRATVAASPRPAGAEPGKAGYVVWARHDEGGREVWDLTLAAAGPGGEVEHLAYLRGATLAAPGGPIRGGGEGPDVQQSRPLRAGEVVDLYSVTAFGEEPSRVVRTAVLKCRVAPAEAARP